jgi:hypothetical protein
MRVLGRCLAETHETHETNGLWACGERKVQVTPIPKPMPQGDQKALA